MRQSPRRIHVERAFEKRAVVGPHAATGKRRVEEGPDGFERRDPRVELGAFLSSDAAPRRGQRSVCLAGAADNRARLGDGEPGALAEDDHREAGDRGRVVVAAAVG